MVSVSSIDALVDFVSENNCMKRAGKQLKELSGNIVNDPHERSLKEFVSLFSCALSDEPAWSRLTYTSSHSLLLCFDAHDAFFKKGLVDSLSEKEWNMVSLPIYSICNTTSSLIYKMNSYTMQLLRRCVVKLEEIQTTKVLQWDAFSTVCPLVRASFARCVRDYSCSDSVNGPKSLRDAAETVLKEERGECKDVVPEAVYNLLCFMDGITNKSLDTNIQTDEEREAATNDIMTLFEKPSTLRDMPFYVQNYAFTDILLPLTYLLSGTRPYPSLLKIMYNFVVDYLHLVPIRVLHTLFKALMFTPTANDSLHYSSYVTAMSKTCAFYIVFVWEDGSWKPECEDSRKADLVDMGTMWHKAYAQILLELPAIEEDSDIPQEFNEWTPFLNSFIGYGERKTEPIEAFVRLTLLTAYTSACFKGVTCNGEALVSSFAYVVMNSMSGSSRKEYMYNCIKRLEASMPNDYVKKLTLSNCSTLNSFFDGKAASSPTGLYEGIRRTVHFYMGHAIYYFNEFLTNKITLPCERIKKILSHDWASVVSLERIAASEKAFEELCQEEEVEKLDTLERSKRASETSRAKKKRACERREQRSKEKQAKEEQKQHLEKQSGKDRVTAECDRKVLAAIERARKDIANGLCIKDSIDRVSQVVARYHNSCSTFVLKEKNSFRSEFCEKKKPHSQNPGGIIVPTKEEQLRLSEALHNLEVEDVTHIGLTTKEIKKHIKMKNQQEADTQVRKRLSQRVVEVSHCPITLCAMEDPVVASDGHTYERSAITDWMSRNNTSPLTGDTFEHKNLVTNYAFRSVLDIVAVTS
ncbi:MAG: hypothetical protein CBC65_001685 [Rhodothermaceae bacterium TMED105]|nr:MAG: hypothetical protein CBC65_001685 [Rhodothermaceae bacterium TMED105]